MLHIAYTFKVRILGVLKVVLHGVLWQDSTRLSCICVKSWTESWVADFDIQDSFYLRIMVRIKGMFIVKLIYLRIIEQFFHHNRIVKNNKHI